MIPLSGFHLTFTCRLSVCGLIVQVLVAFQKQIAETASECGFANSAQIIMHG